MHHQPRFGGPHRFVPIAIALLSSAPCGLMQAASTAHVLWYDAPSTDFTEALPLGNGRLGAAVFGGVSSERIVLNEESMWSGSRQEADRPNAAQALPEIRKLLLQGKHAEAERLFRNHFTCQGQGSALGRGADAPFGCYQVLCDLLLEFSHADAKPQTYRRQLDLATATAAVQYRMGDAEFERVHFISAVDQAFVSRLRASRNAQLSFRLSLARPARMTVTTVADNELLITGTLNDGRGGEGVSYAARLAVRASGGTVVARYNQLVVDGAEEATIFVTAATDYAGLLGERPSNPRRATRRQMDAVFNADVDTMYRAHVDDHRRLYDRAELVLQETACSQLPTDERLRAFAAGEPDPALSALYFHYGRYLLIASSRPGTLPANLQGIWARQIQTPWNGDWHLDINVQMNYWLAEVANLSELHEPLFDLIESLVEPGRKTARRYYKTDGWVAHVFTNPWGFTSPGESAEWGATVSGSAWLCQHLWEHYQFTLDRGFLQRAYPVMKESSVYYQANLFEFPELGWLVTGPSNSPENRFAKPDGAVAHLCLGPTIDMQALRELFQNTVRAAELLGVDDAFASEIKLTASRLAPNQIGPDGRLQEWLEPYDEPEPAHRHLSPLYGLHPGCEITRHGTPALAEACRALLETRGDESTGWGLAWRINLWARLGEGDRAHALLRRLLRPAGSSSGSLPNLWSSCPPFQIDANFGGSAGIAEMLLQSHADEIELLPALPAAWQVGRVSGLRARGGFTIDIAWEAGRLVKARMTADRDANVMVRYGNEIASFEFKAGQTIEVSQVPWVDGK